MSDEEPDAISRFNLDDDPDDGLPPRRYWWSLHRPETYAITALAIAVVSLFTIGPGESLLQAINFALASPGHEKTIRLLDEGFQLGAALLALAAAAISIRDEDEDATWSPPVARAALLLGSLVAILAVIAMIVTALTSTSPDQGFVGG